jgi:hypothetical protein
MAIQSTKHRPKMLDQHGSTARCGTCRTPLRWDVYEDAWIHTLSTEQLDALADLRSGRLIALLRG